MVVLGRGHLSIAGLFMGGFFQFSDALTLMVIIYIQSSRGILPGRHRPGRICGSADLLADSVIPMMTR